MSQFQPKKLNIEAIHGGQKYAESRTPFLPSDVNEIIETLYGTSEGVKISLRKAQILLPKGEYINIDIYERKITFPNGTSLVLNGTIKTFPKMTVNINYSGKDFLVRYNTKEKKIETALTVDDGENYQNYYLFFVKDSNRLTDLDVAYSFGNNDINLSNLPVLSSYTVNGDSAQKLMSEKAVTDALKTVGTKQPTKGLSYELDTSGDYDMYICNGFSTTATDTDTDIVIASQIDGIPVGAIAESAFLGNTSITSVTLGDFVESIADWAFEGCTNLKTINLPNSLFEIGMQAFYNCNSLDKIWIPSVQDISSSAFNGSYPIYCEPREKPEGWDEYWNDGESKVFWNVSYNNGILISHETGESAEAVMSQKAITEALANVKPSGGSSVKIVQETGYSTTSVMSQEATTKALNRKFDEQRTFIDWKKDIESQYEYDEVYNEGYRGTYQFGSGLYDVYYSSDSGVNLAVATFQDFSASTPNFDNQNFDLSQIIVTGDSKSVYLYISREADFNGYPVMDFFTTGDGYENFLLDISKSVYNGKTHLLIDVKHIVNGEPISVSGVKIVQEKGTSETAVMSQKAVTDALSQISIEGGYIDIQQSTGTSTTAVMSQDAVTKAIAAMKPSQTVTIVQTTGSKTDAVMSQNAVTSQISSLQSQITPLQSKTTALETANSSLSSRIGSVESTLSPLPSKVASLEGKNTSLSNRVEALESSVTALNADVSTLKSLPDDVAGLNTSVTGLETRVRKLEKGGVGSSTWTTGFNYNATEFLINIQSNRTFTFAANNENYSNTFLEATGVYVNNIYSTPTISCYINAKNAQNATVYFNAIIKPVFEVTKQGVNIPSANVYISGAMGSPMSNIVFRVTCVASR